MDNHEKLKYQTLRFTNNETVLHPDKWQMSFIDKTYCFTAIAEWIVSKWQINTNIED